MFARWLINGQSRIGIKRSQWLIAHVIDEDAGFYGIPALLRRDLTALDTRDRAVPRRVRIVHPVFLISQLSGAVQRVIFVVHGRHGPLQMVHRIQVVDRVVYVLKIAAGRVTAVTTDRVVLEPVALAVRETAAQQFLATAFGKTRLAISRLMRASCAGRIIVLSGIFEGVGRWWKSRVANVHGMQRCVACQPKVITSNKVN